MFSTPPHMSRCLVLLLACPVVRRGKKKRRNTTTTIPVAKQWNAAKVETE